MLDPLRQVYTTPIKVLRICGEMILFLRSYLRPPCTEPLSSHLVMAIFFVVLLDVNTWKGLSASRCIVVILLVYCFGIDIKILSYIKKITVTVFYND